MSLYEVGVGTTPGMWEMLSDIVDGEALPESLNAALYALRDGQAHVISMAEFQRAVACVNKLAGHTDLDAVEVVPKAEIHRLERYECEYATLLGTNAELVEVLRKIAGQSPVRFIGNTPVYHASAEIARATIAKHEGGKT